MNVLLCNVGYLLGYRSCFGYLPTPRSAVFGDGGAERRSLERVGELIADVGADVVCLIEIDQGSFRTKTMGQVEALLAQLGRRGTSYTAHAFNKYGPHRVLGRLPFFRRLSNAVLCAEDWPTVPRYLTTGMKRLVIETRLPEGITLLTAHLSVRPGSRRKQLEELASLIRTEYADRPVVLAGDFNTYDGMDAVERFEEETGLRRLETGPTIPPRPFDDLLVDTRALDLVFTSPELAVDDVRVIDSRISDHRPVTLELDPMK